MELFAIYDEAEAIALEETVADIIAFAQTLDRTADACKIVRIYVVSGSWEARASFLRRQAKLKRRAADQAADREYAEALKDAERAGINVPVKHKRPRKAKRTRDADAAPKETAAQKRARLFSARMAKATAVAA